MSWEICSPNQTKENTAGFAVPANCCRRTQHTPIGHLGAASQVLPPVVSIAMVCRGREGLRSQGRQVQDHPDHHMIWMTLYTSPHSSKDHCVGVQFAVPTKSLAVHASCIGSRLGFPKSSPADLCLGNRL